MQATTTWPSWKDVAPDFLERGEGKTSRFESGIRAKGTYKQSKPDQPLISYVTVVRNAKATIERTIQSVQNQSYSNVEHIIVDGASQDGTLAIIKKYSDTVDYILSEPDAGLYDALNKAVELCRGDWICVLNADDWLTPNAAQLVASIAGLQRAPESTMILTSALVKVGQNIKTWVPSHIDRGSHLKCANACHNAIYASRQAYQKSGPYDASYKIAGDFKWIMSALDAGVKFIYSDIPSVNYSLGGLSSDLRAHSIECVRVIQERFPCLSTSEGWGLFHALHTFRENTIEFPETRPNHLGDFLIEVCKNHPHETDLLSSIAFGVLPYISHPDDPESSIKKIPRIQKLKNSIRKRYNRFRAGA